MVIHKTVAPETCKRTSTIGSPVKYWVYPSAACNSDIAINTQTSLITCIGAFVK